MLRRNTQSDLKWYVSLKLSLMVWEKATESLHIDYTTIHRKELKEYFENMDYTGNKEEGFHAMYKKIKEHKRRILQDQTANIWLHYLLDIKYKDKRENTILFELFREHQMQLPDQELLDYAILNRYLEDIPYSNQRIELENLCDRIIAIIINYENVEQEIKQLQTLKNTFVSFAIGIDPQKRIEYMKTELQKSLTRIQQYLFEREIINISFAVPSIEDLQR